MALPTLRLPFTQRGNAAPVPLGTPSHLARLFSGLYRSYARDPQAAPAIVWSVPTGGTAYLNVVGCTATLYVTSASAQATYQYNLATDGAGTKPTLLQFMAWLNASLRSFFAASNLASLASGVDGSVSALILVEGFTVAPAPLPLATSLNYIQARVLALVFDLMSADMSNMFSTLSLAGAQGMWLDWIGQFYHLPRLYTSGVSESDDAYRSRMSVMLTQPSENNVAIAAILATVLGTANVTVEDTGNSRATVWVYQPVATPTIVVPLARPLVPGGVVLSGFMVTPNPSGVSALAGLVRAGVATAGIAVNLVPLR